MAKFRWKLVLTSTGVTDLSPGKLDNTKMHLQKGEYSHAFLLFYSAKGKFLFLTDYSPNKAIEEFGVYAPEPVLHAEHYLHCGGAQNKSYGVVMCEGEVQRTIDGVESDFRATVEKLYRDFCGMVAERMKTALKRGYPYDCKGYCEFLMKELTGKKEPFAATSSSSSATSSSSSAAAAASSSSSALG